MDEFTNQDVERIIVIHRDESGGYWVNVPSLPGCMSDGATLREACEMIGDAMELYIEVVTEDGTALPPENHLLTLANTTSYTSP